mmetsp:Transcript_32251/g.67624  ORF Transcript_32251/g.67624 Transcript_32251/m.67624 type:complete len:94 (-) Transcript_32251:2474-2755(-)
MMHVPVDKRQNWEEDGQSSCGSAAGPNSHDCGIGGRVGSDVIGAGDGASVGIFVCAEVIETSSSNDHVAALDAVVVVKEVGRILFMVSICFCL